jgi:hypothetical protein
VANANRKAPALVIEPVSDRFGSGRLTSEPLVAGEPHLRQIGAGPAPHVTAPRAAETLKPRYGISYGLLRP